MPVIMDDSAKMIKLKRKFLKKLNDKETKHRLLKVLRKDLD
jgi:hypothetical protein